MKYYILLLFFGSYEYVAYAMDTSILLQKGDSISGAQIIQPKPVASQSMMRLLPSNTPSYTFSQHRFSPNSCYATTSLNRSQHRSHLSINADSKRYQESFIRNGAFVRNHKGYFSESSRFTCSKSAYLAKNRRFCSQRANQLASLSYHKPYSFHRTPRLFSTRNQKLFRY